MSLYFYVKVAIVEGFDHKFYCPVKYYPPGTGPVPSYVRGGIARIFSDEEMGSIWGFDTMEAAEKAIVGKLQREAQEASDALMEGSRVPTLGDREDFHSDD
jgi:hypothetical protein